MFLPSLLWVVDFGCCVSGDWKFDLTMYFLVKKKKEIECLLLCHPDYYLISFFSFALSLEYHTFPILITELFRGFGYFPG